MLQRVRTLLRRSRTARVVTAAAVLVALGLSGWRLGRHYQAERRLDRARGALDEGRLRDARALLLTCLRDRPQDPDIHLLLARVARRDADFDAFGDYLRRAERLGAVPEQVELEWQLQAVQRGEVVSAERQLWAFTENGHPDTAEILEALARGCLASYRLDDARQALDHLLQLRPRNGPAWALRGRAVYFMRGFGEAEENYRRAAELAPDDVGIGLLLADCLAENAKPAEALTQYERLEGAAADAAALAVRRGRARCLLDLGRHDEARAALERLLTAAPQDAPALVLRGKLELRCADPAGAERWLRRAVALDAADRDAVYNLGRALEQQGKKDDAEKWRAQLKKIDGTQARLSALTKRILASPHDAELRCEAGTLFLEMGNEREGLRWLYSALREDPDHPGTHRALRDHFRRAGRPELAAPHERALTRS